MRKGIMEDLLEIRRRCEAAIEDFNEPKVAEAIDKLTDAIRDIAKAWSGSWLGYHANVYYKNFQSPKPGDHFSIEWGFYRDPLIEPMSDNWVEVTYQDILDEVLKRGRTKNLSWIEERGERPKREFESSRDEFTTIIQVLLSEKSDTFLNIVLGEASEIEILTQGKVITGLRPTGQYMTRDTTAATQGLRTPPHISLEAWLISIESIRAALENLIKVIEKTIIYAQQKEKSEKKRTASNRKVFVGHGRSTIWKDLKDFLQDRLNLEWEEFNREPTAGISTVERLQEMLDKSAFAFIVLTAEDEHGDGELHARENVIHESGLFQGRLGFKKAIILLEEGCAEFSNIHGLGQIRFPKGNISAEFEEIRRVLEREKIINKTDF